MIPEESKLVALDQLSEMSTEERDWLNDTYGIRMGYLEGGKFIVSKIV